MAFIRTNLEPKLKDEVITTRVIYSPDGYFQVGTRCHISTITNNNLYSLTDEFGNTINLVEKKCFKLI